MGRWLRPEGPQARKVVEQVACEGLVNALPSSLAQQVRCHPYKDMPGLLEVLERQLAVYQAGGTERHARGNRQGWAAIPEPSRRAVEAPQRPKEKLASPRYVTYLKSVMPSTIDEGFFDFLREVDSSSVSVAAIPEGSVVFPKVCAIDGSTRPIASGSVTGDNLVSTNAARFCLAAGSNKKLLEFGLRRAQGPDGGLSASRYSYIGGFHGSSNVLAGKYFNIPVVGTMAHSFITSFSSLKEVHPSTLISENGEGPPVDLVKLSVFWLNRVCSHLHMTPEEANKGELAAFISYAIAFPRNFLALLDTYSVIRSGAVNFCTVALALCQLNYQPVGVRLDSGDLCRQSVDLRRIFHSCSTEFQVPGFKSLVIIGSNSISEQSVMEMKEQLVQVNGKPRMKFCEDPEKATLPGRKAVYRLYNNDGILDLLYIAKVPISFIIPTPITMSIEMITIDQRTVTY
ncbi:PNCB phosphoribosyltransferase, partial [Polypterus senegalus]